MRNKTNMQHYGNYHGPYIIDNKLYVDASNVMVAKPQLGSVTSHRFGDILLRRYNIPLKYIKICIFSTPKDLIVIF